jgi:hypothetical protein
MDVLVGADNALNYRRSRWNQTLRFTKSEYPVFMFRTWASDFLSIHMPTQPPSTPPGLRATLFLASHLLTATRRADLPRGEFPIQGVGWLWWMLTFHFNYILFLRAEMVVMFLAVQRPACLWWWTYGEVPSIWNWGDYNLWDTRH